MKGDLECFRCEDCNQLFGRNTAMQMSGNAGDVAQASLSGAG
jgi:hypothetical protein